MIKWLRLSCYILCLLVFTSNHLTAQEGRAEDSLTKKYAAFISTSPADHQYYLLIGKKAALGDYKVIREIETLVSVVEVTGSSVLTQLQKVSVLYPANDNWKLSPMFVRKQWKNKTIEQRFVLTGKNINTLLISLRSKSPKVSIQAIHFPSNSVVIQCKPSVLQNELLKNPEVIFIDIATFAKAETNIIGYDRSFHGINAIDYLLPGANGKNIMVGVKEQRMDDNDLDLWKRVLPSSLAEPTVSYHATTIASIIGGAGNSSYEGRGLAWGCKFYPSSYSNLFADDAATLSANKVSVQNHSYGTIIQQFYGAEAVSYDLLACNNKAYVAVFSAGNQGLSAASEGKYAGIAGFANLTGSFKMAKNIITVAAIDNKNILSPLSSLGPVYDGRLAPQLTALGPNGTSDASAIVSGTIAVLQQVYADSNSQVLPAASLVKTVLFNTADDINTQFIDYKTGYGLLNSYAAVRAIQQRYYDGGTLSNGQQWIKNITIPSNAAQLKVTLTWTDTAASVNNNKALVNDLDLEVIDLNTNSVYQPWVLSAAANKDSLVKEPIRKRDSLNTAEQVSIRLPAAGNYQVKVKGTSVVNAPTPFHISYKVDTLNTFVFTSPLHASDVNPANNETYIRWQTFIADTTQTADLYITYNSGTNWQLIKQSVKLVDGKYKWTIKDTVAAAWLKMETSFGTFQSQPFILSRPTQLNIDFNCTDSFRLSWQKHVFANGYKVFTLTDSPYLKHIITATDTFLVLKKTLYPSVLYAVEPVLNNGLNAARSQAINIDLQGVHCFYKTLNYSVQDANHLALFLELSTTASVDSVFFELVTAGGQLLKTYGSTRVINGTLIYNQGITDITEGVMYIRGRIKLQNGSSVYTDIVSILTSGRKKIWFYPVPAKKNLPLNYVLQQGISPDSQLLFYDISGRLLLRITDLGNPIDVSRFSGVIIFKLIDGANGIAQTGKLVIH
jgi:hypothetical protein